MADSYTSAVRHTSETVTLNTATKEWDQILPLLEPTIEYTSEDGFVGILTLDVASIKVETAGTYTTSYTMSVAREYPHLSANDTSLVPKTVDDRGTSYSLADVNWTAGNTVTVDYESLPEYYTANANYTATGYSTRVTGYTTTAVYTGTIGKLSQGKTVYTAYFLGEEICAPIEPETPVIAEEVVEESGEIEPTEAEVGAEPAETQPETANKNARWIAALAAPPCFALLIIASYQLGKRSKK